MRFANGAVGTLSFNICSYEKNMEGSITIFGEKGTVKIGGQYLNELEYQCGENFSIKHLQRSKAANDYGEYQGTMANHHLVYENVVQCLTNGDDIAVNGIEGMQTVKIIEAIYRSVVEGRTVYLN